VFTFYDPLPPSGNVPSMVSFTQTYTRTGSPRQVKPTSTAPVSPFNWAGEIWMATASVAFSVAHTDGSFSAQGTGQSNGQFGEVGFERNGLFLTQSPMVFRRHRDPLRTATETSHSEPRISDLRSAQHAHPH